MRSWLDVGRGGGGEIGKVVESMCTRHEFGEFRKRDADGLSATVTFVSRAHLRPCPGNAIEVKVMIQKHSTLVLDNVFSFLLS